MAAAARGRTGGRGEEWGRWHVAGGALLVLLAAREAPADTGCVRAKPGGRSRADAIGIVFSGEPRDEAQAAAVLQEALAMWRVCPQFGERFPTIGAGVAAGRSTYVVRFEGYNASPRCGYTRGNTIVVHAAARAGGKLAFCGRPARILAHELGHVLGLADAPEDSGCMSGIMSAVGTQRRDRARVLPEECRAVEQRWRLAEVAAW